jgi:hypothetical protein
MAEDRMNQGRISCGVQRVESVLLGPGKPYHSLPFRQPTPGRLDGCLGVGRPQGEFTISFQRPPGPIGVGYRVSKGVETAAE